MLLNSSWKLLLLLLIASTLAMAQDTSFDDEEFQPIKGHPGFFASGGLIMQTLTPDLTPINDEIARMGIPKLKKTMFLTGFQAFGSVQKFRIGIFYLFGSNSTSGTVQDTTSNGAAVFPKRDVSLTASITGISTGYRITLPNSIELEPGLWLGYSSMQLELMQRLGDGEWSDAWEPFQRYSSSAVSNHTQMTLKTSYYFVQPGVLVRYYPKSWLAIGIGAQYVLPLSNPNKWKFGGETISNGKKVDVGSANGVLTVSFGI